MQELRRGDEREQEAGTRRSEVERDRSFSPHRVCNHASIAEQVIRRRCCHHHLSPHETVEAFVGRRGHPAGRPRKKA